MGLTFRTVQTFFLKLVLGYSKGYSFDSGSATFCPPRRAENIAEQNSEPASERIDPSAIDLLLLQCRIPNSSEPLAQNVVSTHPVTLSSLEDGDPSTPHGASSSVLGVISLAEAPPTGTHAANADADADAFKSTPCPIQRDQESDSLRLLSTPSSRAGSTPSTAGSTPSTTGSTPSTTGSTPSTAGSTPSTTGKESSTPPAADTLPLDRFTNIIINYDSFKAEAINAPDDEIGDASLQVGNSVIMTRGLPLVHQLASHDNDRRRLDSLEVLMAAIKRDFDEKLASSKQEFDVRLASSKQEFDERLASSKQEFDEKLAVSDVKLAKFKHDERARFNSLSKFHSKMQGDLSATQAQLSASGMEMQAVQRRLESTEQCNVRQSDKISVLEQNAVDIAMTRLRDLVHLARAFRTISLDQRKRVPSSIWEVAMVELAPINSSIVHGPFGDDKKSWRECFTMGKLTTELSQKQLVYLQKVKAGAELVDSTSGSNKWKEAFKLLIGNAIDN